MLTLRYQDLLGSGSASERFLGLNGKIILLGSEHDSVMFLHYVEHVADFPAKRIARYQIPALQDGHRVWLPRDEIDSSDGGAHANWPERFFAKIVDGMLGSMGEPWKSRRKCSDTYV